MSAGNELTKNLPISVRLLIDLLHVNMVHLSFVEWIGLLSSAPITISILRFRALRGIVSSLPALEASDVTQIFLHWCRRVEMLLVAIPSIAISMLVTMVVVSISSMLNVASMVMMIPSKLASA